jgi:hypothetical protein
MREYDSKYGYDGTGALEEMIARVQDIKASPYAGKKRLVVKKEGAERSHAVIDIDMKDAKDIVRSTSRPRADREDRRDTRSVRDQERRPQKSADEKWDRNKGKYIFQVKERDDSKNPGFQRKKSAEFKAYDCEEKPQQFTSELETNRRMNRFGGGSSTGKAKRTKF